MALIKCPECGKEISDKSKICINCGFPIYEQKLEVYEKTIYKTETLFANFEDGYTLNFENGIISLKQDGKQLYIGEIYNVKLYGTKKGFFNNGILEAYFPKTYIPRDLKCLDEDSYENCIKIFEYYKNKGFLKKKEFNGIYRVKWNGEQEEVYCINCKSENCSEYKDQIVVPEKTKTTVSLNLNPLKPFTVANINEKVIRKGYSIQIKKYICNDCGEIF